MQSFFPVQSIIKKLLFIFIFFITITNDSLSMNDTLDDKGVIVLMYHRFEENKYPSTNIKIADFVKHLDLIKNNNFKLVCVF